MTILASATTILAISHDLSPWTLGGGWGGFDDKKSINGDYRKLTANLLQRGGRGRGEDHKNDTGPYGGIK